MGTPKSNSGTKKWIAGASVFSGRPNPTWTVPQVLALQLLKIWDSLESTSEKPPVAPPLGYRGCSLKDPTGRQWFAYGNVVIFTKNGECELRRDREGSFERLLAIGPNRCIAARVYEANWSVITGCRNRTAFRLVHTEAHLIRSRLWRVHARSANRRLRN
jgi:hypothetical protein